jgi:hypothetical protein
VRASSSPPTAAALVTASSRSAFCRVHTNTSHINPCLRLRQCCSLRRFASYELSRWRRGASRGPERLANWPWLEVLSPCSSSCLGDVVWCGCAVRSCRDFAARCFRITIQLERSHSSRRLTHRTESPRPNDIARCRIHTATRHDVDSTTSSSPHSRAQSQWRPPRRCTLSIGLIGVRPAAATAASSSTHMAPSTQQHDETCEHDQTRPHAWLLEPATDTRLGPPAVVSLPLDVDRADTTR